jgi:hypothetical protein
MRRIPLLLLAVATVLTAAAPAFAHTPPRSAVVFTPPTLNEALTAAAPEPTLPWTAVAVLATAALVAAWRPRRAVAVGLMLMLGLLAFETGVHSTHHLGQPDEFSRCVVAGVSAQLSADLVDVTLDTPPSPVPNTPLVVPAAPAVAARVVAPDAGRAPPVFSA